MRTAFEAWAQRDGHIVRRREDKPEEYLVFETQRRWVIWQAALEHGKTPGGRKTAAQKEAAAAEKRAAEALQRPPVINSDEAAVRTLQPAQADIAALNRATDSVGLAVFAPADAADRSRIGDREQQRNRKPAMLARHARQSNQRVSTSTPNSATSAPLANCHAATIQNRPAPSARPVITRS